MPSTQPKAQCKIYLHPATSSRQFLIDAFERRTGLRAVITPRGLARAIPKGGQA